MQLQTTSSESKFPNECISVIFLQIDQHLKKLLKKIQRGPDFMEHSVLILYCRHTSGSVAIYVSAARCLFLWLAWWIVAATLCIRYNIAVLIAVAGVQSMASRDRQVH